MLIPAETRRSKAKTSPRRALRECAHRKKIIVKVSWVHWLGLQSRGDIYMPGRKKLRAILDLKNPPRPPVSDPVDFVAAALIVACLDDDLQGAVAIQVKQAGDGIPLRRFITAVSSTEAGRQRDEHLFAVRLF